MAEITLYQLEHCPFSHRVRHMLGARGVDYRIVNVPQQRDERDDLECLSGTRDVPVLLIDGRAYVHQTDIGSAIASRYPRDPDEIGDFERASAPVFIARLDTRDVDEANERVTDAFRRAGVECRRDAVEVPGVERSFVIAGDYMQRFVAIEPRTRSTLPLRAAIVPHENGLSVQLLMPEYMWFHMRNVELNRAASAFQRTLVDALHMVSEKSNV